MSPSCRNFCWRLTTEKQSDLSEGVIDADDDRITLTDSEQLLCARGRDKLLHIQNETTFSWLYDGTLPLTGCQTPSTCATALLTISLSITRPNVLFNCWSDSWDRMLCPSCSAAAHGKHSNGRTAAWDRLPTAFEFVSWQDLSFLEEETVSTSLQH